MSTSTRGGPVPGKRRVCVIGAGVIGLSTALQIHEESAGWGMPGVEVTVVADRHSPHTTSDGSGGFWEPYGLGDTPISLIRGDEVLVGGMAQNHNWSEDVDSRDSEAIWTRAVAVFPFIKGGRTLREWAGLRPGRSTVRLEADSCTVMERRVPVVHNYGYGGAGVTLHWGCAAQAAA